MVDYYQILEIERTATCSDIKRAYRTLALKWHPDKNLENVQEANRRFKELSEAYEVLIDDRKGGIYDQYGKQGLERFGNWNQQNNAFVPRFASTFAFRNPQEVFREFFASPPHMHPPAFPGPGVHFGPNNYSYPYNNNVNASYVVPIAPNFNYSTPPPFNNMPRGPPRNFAACHTFPNYGTGSGGGTVHHTNIITEVINGKKITTKNIFDNGIITVLRYENDMLQSKTVNGMPQSIMYG